MVKIIKEIVEKLKENLSSEKNIVSGTIVGSFSNLNKVLGKFNDLDIVLICDKIDEDFLKSLKGLIRKLQKEYSSKMIGITHSLKIGPIKISSDKQKTIMLHFLIYTKDGYKKYESTLTRFSFQHYKPFLGRALSKINRRTSVIVKDLFNEIDGIPAMKNWITKKEVFYLEPSSSGVKIIKKSIDSNLYLEVIFYSVLRLSSNMLRTKGIYAETNLQMCKMFKKEFKINLNKLPYEIYKAKNKLRSGKNFNKDKIKDIRQKSLNFINECEMFLGRYKNVEKVN